MKFGGYGKLAILVSRLLRIVRECAESFASAGLIAKF